MGSSERVGEVCGGGGKGEGSVMYMAEVRPVRQPWSRCVAHQSSSVEEVVELVELGGLWSGMEGGAGEGK